MSQAGAEATVVARWMAEVQGGRSLDTVLKVEAQRLCAFSSSLTPEEAAEYLGLELDVWHTVRHSLADSRIFTGLPPNLDNNRAGSDSGGNPSVHELTIALRPPG
jgi:hypothetical protein